MRLLRDAFLLIARLALAMLTLTCVEILLALDVDRYDAIAGLATNQLLWLALYLANQGLAALCQKDS